MTQNCINNRGMSWSSVNASQVSMYPNNGYIDLNSGNNPSQFKLPTLCQPGDQITIINFAKNSTRITQSEGQQIFYGDLQLQSALSTTLGIDGYIEIDKLYAITLRCVAPNLTFVVESYTGALLAG